MPPGATIVLGADDTVERRSGRKITAKGCYRDAVRSTKKHVIRCFGLKWVSMMLLVPVPWAGGSGRCPFSPRCAGRKKQAQRRHKTSVDWVRQMIKQVRRWLPGQRLVLVVDGGFAAVSLALAWVKHPVVMVSRLRWDAALYHRPGPQPAGQAGPQTLEGQAPTKPAGLGRAAPIPPGKTVEVDWYGGQRKQLWVFSHTALWYTPGLPPVDIRFVLVCDPEGKLRMEAFFCTDLQATPAQILAWVVMRWSVEVTFEEARAHLGLETQRQWSDQAIARTTPVLLALFSLVTVLALKLSQDGQIPVPVTAWYRKDEPTFSDCLALVRWHLWRARYVVNSTAEPEFVQFPREAVRSLAHWPSSRGLNGQSRV